MSKSVSVHTQRRGHIAVVEVSIPSRRNALSTSVKEELLEALRAVDDDDNVHVIVLCGANNTFIAGADVSEMAPWNPRDVEHPSVWGWYQRFALIRKPIIAGVEGYALGGGLEVLLACDTAVIAEDAVLGLPEITLGIMPAGGGIGRLVATIGKARAIRMICTGERISGVEAFDLGIASVLSKSGSAVPDAINLAERMAQYSPLALQLIKDALTGGQGMSEGQRLLLERRNFALLFSTAEQHEGMQGFLDKRAQRKE